MILLFDIGNTDVKWATCENGVLNASRQFVYAQNQIAMELKDIALNIQQPAAIAIACVADDNRAESFSWLTSEIWQMAPWFAAVENRACGVRNAYADIAQLGIDRWLALISAWNTYKKPLCVIDCGTAVTVDLIDADGHHTGGFIIPGRAMMQRSLVDNAAQVAITISKSFVLAPGRSTQDCVNNGCAFAIIGFLEQIIKQTGFDARDELEYILTGSDAKCMGHYLSHAHHYDQDLVLKGLLLLMDIA